MNATSPESDVHPCDAPSKLWSFEFGRADCIMTTVAICLFAAHISYALYRGPEHIENKNHFSGLWAIAITQFGILIARPSSNTTRIPAVIWIALGVMAILFNFWFFHQ